jgi:hypothetical protein
MSEVSWRSLLDDLIARGRKKPGHFALWRGGHARGGNGTGKDLHKDPDRGPAVAAAGDIRIAVSWFARLRSDHLYHLAVLLISVMAMWVSLWLAAFS